MGALEVITGRVTNVGGVITAVTMNSGDTNAVRNMPPGQNAMLEGVWAQSASAGVVRVRSNRLHDAAQALRWRVAPNVIRELSAFQSEQILRSQDALVIEQSGGGAETDSVALLISYPSIDGINARLATWDQIKPRVANLMVQEVPVAGPVAAGDWSPGTVINTAFDTLKAGVDYAVLGYVTDTACNTIAIRGSDTGNVRVGGPGPLEPIETRDYFARMSQAMGSPYIPVLNMANKLAIQAFVQLNTAGGTINVGFNLAELTPA